MINNLESQSFSVFGIKGYELIFKYLAYWDNSINPITITEATNYYNKGQNNKEKQRDWKTIKKMFMGARDTIGLVPNEYVNSIKKGKEQKYVFHMKFKGFLASLSSGIKPEDIAMYDEYLKFIKSWIKNDNIYNLIKKHIENEIHLFLLIHSKLGIQLVKLKNTTDYFELFFGEENIMDQLYRSYGKEYSELELIKQKYRNYATSGELLHRLGIDFFVDLDESKIKYQFIKPHKLQDEIIKLLKNGIDLLVYQWPSIMERMYLMNNFTFEKYLKEDRKKPKYEDDPLPKITEKALENERKKFNLPKLPNIF